VAVRISVIVAVFNTGEYLEPLLDTLRRQSLPDDEYEVILVDDGSSDEWTIARIDREAAERANVIVRHEPNSGWPGRPRNVGMDAARGKYVFFADHDDWFGIEALERMADYADACGSDVLVPRYAGHHRGVAKAMFGRSQPAATLESTPLMDSLTPHKLFRLEFLREIGLRFPEGRRRLEDHVFVVEAYFRAGIISVLADYHCYFHVGRPDAGNAAFNRIDPPSYYGYVREVIDIVYRHTSPGPLRDRVLRRPLRQELLGRLDGAGLLTRPREHTEAVFAECKTIADELLPASLDAGLSPPQRVRATLLRAGRLDDLLAYVEHQARIKARVRLTGLSWTADGELELALEGSLRDGDGPVTYVRSDAELRLTEPSYAGGAPVGVRVDTGTSPLRSGSLQLVLRRRADSEEWPVPVRSTQAQDESGALVSASYRGTGRFDPRTLGGGRLLTPGVWDLYAKVGQTGWSKEARLGSLRADDVVARPAVLDGLAFVPYWTETYDNLSLDVRAGATAFVRAARPSVSVDDGRLDVRLDFVGEPPAELRLVFDGATVPLTASGSSLRGALPDGPDGRFPLSLLAGADWWTAPVPIGAELVRSGGRVSVTTRAASAPKPEPAPTPTTARRTPMTPRSTARRAVQPIVGNRGLRALRKVERKVRQVRRERARRLLAEDEARRWAETTKDLTALAKHFKTDKWGNHYYTPHYQRHLEHLREQPIRLLEIGIGGYARAKDGGASLRMWKHFFPKSQIVGLDIEDKSFVEEDRIKVYQGDQSDPELLRRIHEESGPFDVIIDDGSHRVWHVLPSFQTLFPLLKDDGIYVIEDIQSSYWPEWGGSEDRNSTETSMGLCKQLADGLNYEEFVDEPYEPTYTDTHVTGVFFYHNLVFIQKGENKEGSKRRQILKDRYAKS